MYEYLPLSCQEDCNIRKLCCIPLRLRMPKEEATMENEITLSMSFTLIPSHILLFNISPAKFENKVQKNYKLITGSFLAFNRDYNKKKSPANFIPNDNEYSSDVTFEMNWKEPAKPEPEFLNFKGAQESIPPAYVA